MYVVMYMCVCVTERGKNKGRKIRRKEKKVGEKQWERERDGESSRRHRRGINQQV